MSDDVEKLPPEVSIPPASFPDNHRAGYVALVGRPNVGKSTLMNALVGRKLAIVTSTPQTTRQRILGVLSRPEYQIVFLDTPGVLQPRYRLQERMLEQAMAAIGDADVIVTLVEARKSIRPRELELVRDVASRRGERPLIVVLNKVDRIYKPDLLPVMAELAAIDGVTDILPISALQSDGVPQLETMIASRLPKSPPYFPSDALSDQPERFFVAELIREKVFEQFGEEIPFSTAVMIDTFEDRPNRKLHIRASVIVERASQKGILIGKNGAALKQVGSDARVEIEAWLERPVYLELWATVRKKWRGDERFLREMGL